jgi:hypothetical protein
MSDMIIEEEHAFKWVVYIYSTVALTVALYLYFDEGKKHARSMNTSNASSTKDSEKWIDIDHIPPPSNPSSPISTPIKKPQRPSRDSPASFLHPPPSHLKNRDQKTADPAKRPSKLPHEIYPKFPTLRMREVISNTTIYPNSRAPIPFKTNLFDGKILFLLKTKPQDPKYKEFFGKKKRMLEIHLQGKFLKQNDKDSTIFIGGEVKGSMNLGSMAKGIAGLMLKMVKSLSYGQFDHSFGGTCDDLPHIVTSLYQGVDRFVMTPEGETPPVLGKELPEAEKDRKLRRSSSSNLIVNPSTIYSLSYHTM